MVKRIIGNLVKETLSIVSICSRRCVLRKIEARPGFQRKNEGRPRLAYDPKRLKDNMEADFECWYLSGA